jgi:putative transport protein
MKAILEGISAQPFILLFAVVAIGYLIGRINVKGIGLGATASTLLVGLAVSLFAVQRYGLKLSIPEFASTLFFNLFMFSVGMKVGPQFVSGLRRDASKFIILGLLIPILALGLTLLVREIFHPPPGVLPGILAGANTATPGLGAADAALPSAAARITASGFTVEAARANMSTAFAFTYCISMILFIVMMRVPDLLGAKTAAAAKAFEASIRGASDAPLPGACEEFFSTTLPTTLPVGIRTFVIEKNDVVGRAVKTLREAHPLISVERVLRGEAVLDPVDDLVLMPHDQVTLYGRIETLVAAGPHLGPEIYDRVARDVGAETVDVVVHRSEVVGHKLGDVARDAGHGLYLNGLFRGGEAVPFGPETVLEKGDVLRVTGSRYRIKFLERESGQVVRASLATDIVTLAVGLAVGSLIGAITIPIGGVKFALGSAVGLLLVGIGLSTIRTHDPRFGGPYPEPARRLIEDLGLNVFVAILGINAGAGVLRAIGEGALTPIVVGCLVVGFVPAIIAWFVGRKFLKMNSALLLGAVAGGRCNSAGMRAASEVSQSNVPAISYPVTFAISNIVLTLMSYGLALLG